MGMRDFDKIKNYEEFKRYKWTWNELKEICKNHGLKFVGTEKELTRVIESYYNGVVIPPRRTWYTNKELSTFVNENALMNGLTLSLSFVSVLMCSIGIINMARGLDDTHYVLYLAFGIPLLIMAILCVQGDRTFEVFKSYFPKCGDKSFTREQIDEQANSEDSEYISSAGIILAPDMLIGTTLGVAAVAYEDISHLRIKQTWHQERIGGRYSNKYREYYTYKITVITKTGKAVGIAKTTENPDKILDKIYPYILKYNPEMQPPELKNSLLAPDNKPKQVTEGKGIKTDVDKALNEQFLTRITVNEETKKRFIRYKLRAALVLIPISFAIAAGAAGLFFLIWRVPRLSRGTAPLLIGILFPFYAIYCFFKTLISIRKGDIDFYSGEVVNKREDGYVIKGLSYNLGYIEKMKPEPEPYIGDKVIIARLMNEYSLVAEKSNRSDIGYGK